MVQIDIDMPSNCWDCIFGLPRHDGGHFVYCMAPKKVRLMTVQEAKEKRADNCPLIDTGEEFEWCHDCKEYDQEKHCCPRWNKVIRNTVEELKQTRPNGKWKRISGYCTPGGDPVWCCSECGKGIHVYGIEHGSYGADIAEHQWVACPNCGADMRGEEDGND